MKIASAGHVYEVENVDGNDRQTIRFVRRRGPNGEPLPSDQREEGILSQELLRVLIDRTLYLNAEAPCDEDVAIVDHLRSALGLYESRAARRSIERLARPEMASPCPDCGHILCLHQR